MNRKKIRDIIAELLESDKELQAKIVLKPGQLWLGDDGVKRLIFKIDNSDNVYYLYVINKIDYNHINKPQRDCIAMQSYDVKIFKNDYAIELINEIDLLKIFGVEKDEG